MRAARALTVALGIASTVAFGTAAAVAGGATDPASDPTRQPSAHDPSRHGDGGAIVDAEGDVDAPTGELDPGSTPSGEFDIVEVSVTRDGDELLFRMRVAGTAGATIPALTGALPGAEVYSYVWPTTLDSSVVGFGAEQGILALAVTAHPDFDDTPNVDEDGNGDPDDDGARWHTHWVVLTADDECGPGALKVRDIPDGETPPLPPTWPGLPILIDSPDLVPTLADGEVSVRAPIAVEAAADLSFDGVTAGLVVNADLHAPLLCVSGVFDVASDDLSLPGTVD